MTEINEYGTPKMSLVEALEDSIYFIARLCSYSQISTEPKAWKYGFDKSDNSFFILVDDKDKIKNEGRIPNLLVNYNRDTKQLSAFKQGLKYEVGKMFESHICRLMWGIDIKLTEIWNEVQNEKNNN